MGILHMDLLKEIFFEVGAFIIQKKIIVKYSVDLV